VVAEEAAAAEARWVGAQAAARLPRVWPQLALRAWHLRRLPPWRPAWRVEWPLKPARRVESALKPVRQVEPTLKPAQWVEWALKPAWQVESTLILAPPWLHPAWPARRDVARLRPACAPALQPPSSLRVSLFSFRRV
jgi:hypothetical protein